MRRQLGVWLVALVCVVPPQWVMAREVPSSFADLVEKLSPAVVNISTTQKVKGPGLTMKFQGLPEGEEFDPFREFFERFGGDMNNGKPREVTSLGSGFVVDPQGYVVTNNHVIAEADEITVTFHDDTKLKAKIIGRDAKTDLALLRVDNGDKPLPFVTFGDSDAARVGDWVLAIGNPFGLGGSVSAGIISARSRNINAGPFDDFIQTDAAINRGNSGGPLFDTEGKVIGVNSAIFSPSGGNVGIGFSIPSVLAEPVLKQLREFGRTHRGWLGVKIQYVSDEIADSLGLKQASGALVLEVTADSPAAKGGVESGDVILSFDGRAVDAMRALPRMVAETKIGKRVQVVVWRKGREKSLSLVLGEMDETEEQQAAKSAAPEPASEIRSESYLGMSLTSLTRALRERFGIEPDIVGVLVVEVAPTGVAVHQGIHPQDVIVEVNQEAVETVLDLKEAVKKAADDDRKYALLRVNRRGTMLFITLPVKEK